jgi:hypothetical protein
MRLRLTASEEALLLRVRPLIADKERFRPPRVRDIGGMIGVGETEIRRLFKPLGRLGKVDEVAHDHFFLRGTVAEMAEIAAGLAAKTTDGQFTAAVRDGIVGNGALRSCNARWRRVTELQQPSRSSTSTCRDGSPSPRTPGCRGCAFSASGPRAAFIFWSV